MLSFRFWRHLRDRELSSPRLVQSASWQSTSWRIRELSSCRRVALRTARIRLFVGCCRAQCVHIPNRGFRRGSYRCDCPPSRLSGAATRASNGSGSAADPRSLDGVELERAYVDNLLTGVFGPPASCSSCERACMAEYDPLVRGVPLGVQALCITVTVILTIVIVRLRKTKVRNLDRCCPMNSSAQIAQT